MENSFSYRILVMFPRYDFILNDIKLNFQLLYFYDTKYTGRATRFVNLKSR